MNQGFGHEVPTRHAQQEHRQISRYLVVISSGGDRIARLFLDDFQQVQEFDAGTEEVSAMIQSAAATAGAGGAEWDRALAGHSAEERADATVYVLDI